MTNPNNPFAQPEPEPAPEPVNVEYGGITPVPFAGQERSSEAISVTLKGSTGHDAPWIVVKGATVADVRTQLQDIAQADLFTLAAQAAAAWRRAAGGAAPKPQPPQSAPPQRQASNGWQTQTQQPAAPVGSPGAPAGSCEHGPLQLVQWEYNGKQLAQYKCPLKAANYKDPNGCDRKVWADKVQAAPQGQSATPPF